MVIYLYKRVNKDVKQKENRGIIIVKYLEIYNTNNMKPEENYELL